MRMDAVPLTMEDYKQLTKSAGLKMIPFLKSVCAYFLLGAHNRHGEGWTTILKCAPIISLILFVLLYENQFPRRSTYAHNILFGLIFSCLGDALLNHGQFPQGMAAFGTAQIFYIYAFKFQPLKIWIAAVLYAGGLATVLTLHKRLESIILIGLPIYTFLLVTMCWRSVARACDPKISSTNYLPTLCALGSILFVISDTLIAFDKFNAPIPNSTILIMSTYYAAQFAITLSVVNMSDIKHKLQPNSSQSSLDAKPNNVPFISSAKPNKID